MKQLTAIMVMIMGLLLMACTAVTDPEPAAESDSDTGQPSRPILATPEAVSEEMVEDNDGQTAVTPVVVDMSKVTPESSTGDNMQEMPQPGIPDAGRAMIEKVRQDLANRNNVDVTAVTVVQADGVQWPDSSLGCPQPDMMYLMVITPGYRIVLELNGEEYYYHTDQDSYFVLCPEDQALPPYTYDQ